MENSQILARFPIVDLEGGERDIVMENSQILARFPTVDLKGGKRDMVMENSQIPPSSSPWLTVLLSVRPSSVDRGRRCLKVAPSALVLA